MFTYTLSNKAIENGQNRITVDYTNGTVKCTETFFFSSKEDLDNRITKKIASLNKVVELDTAIVTAGYVKTEPTPTPAPTPVQIAEQKLYDLKRLIELGVMKETDIEYVTAVTAYKTAISTK